MLERLTDKGISYNASQKRHSNGILFSTLRNSTG